MMSENASLPTQEDRGIDPTAICDCGFDAFDDGSTNESYHFKRKCRTCGEAFWSLHCIHEGQRDCGKCDRSMFLGKLAPLDTTGTFGAREALKTLNAIRLPDLGDAQKFFMVEMTEPEINAVHAAVAFVVSECTQLETLAGGQIKSTFLAHYGPTLNNLSDRLA